MRAARGELDIRRGALAAGMAGKFLDSRRSTASLWLTENFAARMERVASETNRLVARVAKAAASAFDIPVMPLEISPVQFDLGDVAFDLLETSQALDVNEMLVPLMDFFLPSRVVAARAVRQAEAAMDDWFLRNLNRLDEHMMDWIDRTTRLLHESMQERLDSMRKEIVGAVELGRIQAAKGKAAIAERLDTIEHQRAQLMLFINK